MLGPPAEPFGEQFVRWSAEPFANGSLPPFAPVSSVSGFLVKGFWPSVKIPMPADPGDDLADTTSLEEFRERLSKMIAGDLPPLRAFSMAVMPYSSCSCREPPRARFSPWLTSCQDFCRWYGGIWLLSQADEQPAARP
jgi:hypothetical protein